MSESSAELGAFQEGPWTIVINKRERLIFRSNMGGLQPLIQAVSQYGAELDGATVYDKVIGRAAAFIIAASSIRRVATPVASIPAIEILRRAGKSIRCLEKVPRILDADRRDLERFEKLSLDAATPEQFLRLLQR